MRATLLDINQSALSAVSVEALLPRWLKREGDWLRIADQAFLRSGIGQLYVLSVGKAAAAMAYSAEQILGNWISEGIALTKDGYTLKLKHMRCFEAGHPVPDKRGVEATLAVENLLQGLSQQDLVLVLLSGGASSLLADPLQGLSLEAIVDLSTKLLLSGADIREVNTVRKHFSRLKGGQLTRRVYPARLICLALSDVIDDAPEVIGSGPTVADPTTFQDAAHVLEKYDLLKSIDPQLAEWLQKGLRGEIPETPKPGDPVFAYSRFYLIGNNQLALQEAARRAMELGYVVRMDTRVLCGESRDQAVAFAKVLENYDGPRPACILKGGETTVSVMGTGIGGRNQEFALALLDYWLRMGMDMHQIPTVLCAATDGTDGPTDAAGAIVDAALVAWCKASGVDVSDFLRRNDSYSFFKMTDAQLFTGATFTNAMDLVIGMIL